MTTGDYITKEELREELARALTPIKDDLEELKGTLKGVRRRTNQMYDALEKHGLPLVQRETRKKEPA